jgi:hypothetical protein
MTFEAYWNRLAGATPGLRRHDGSMRLSVLSFQQAIRRAYEQGRADALEDAAERHHSSMPDFMRKLFGGRR